jgi:hypothetical protein
MIKKEEIEKDETIKEDNNLFKSLCKNEYWWSVLEFTLIELLFLLVW